MTISEKLMTAKYFPKVDIPFGEMLNDIFFNPGTDVWPGPWSGFLTAMRAISAAVTGKMDIQGEVTGDRLVPNYFTAC